MARRSKCTPDRIRKIAELLGEDSAPDEIAARAAGISPASFYVWFKRGETTRDAIIEADPDTWDSIADLIGEIPTKERDGQTVIDAAILRTRSETLRGLLPSHIDPGEIPYLEFLANVERARAKGNADIWRLWKGAAEERKDWRGYQALMAARQRANARREVAAGENTAGGDVTLDLSGLSIEQLEAMGRGLDGGTE